MGKNKDPGEKGVRKTDTEEKGIFGDEKVEGWNRAILFCRREKEIALLAYRLASVHWVQQELLKVAQTQEGFLSESPYHIKAHYKDKNFPVFLRLIELMGWPAETRRKLEGFLKFGFPIHGEQVPVPTWPKLSERKKARMAALRQERADKVR